jgi:hypothetical protein
VTVWHRRQDLACQLLGEKNGPLGLATAADPSLAATEGQQVFGTTLRTAQTGKASVQPTTGKKLFD